MRIYVGLLLLLAIIGCGQENCELDYKNGFFDQYPSCFESRIDDVLRYDPKMPRSYLGKYLLYDKVVYRAVNFYEVDHAGVTYTNENCEIVCGINYTANTNTCEESPQLIEIVWMDMR